MHLLAPIDVEPWSAQSTKRRATIRDTVQQLMLEKNLHAPLAEERLCITVVSFVPRSRGPMDVDNLVKGLLDSRQGILCVNGWQVQCLTSRRLLTHAPTGAYLVSARVVYPYGEDVIYDDALPLNIAAGARIEP